MGYFIGITTSLLMIFSSLFLIINYTDSFIFNIGLLGNLIFSWVFIEILLNHGCFKKEKVHRDTYDEPTDLVGVKK